MSYSIIIKDFFEYLQSKTDKNNYSHVLTAFDKANKAISFEKSGDFQQACEYWRKIFGNEFPTHNDKNNLTNSVQKIDEKIIINPPKQWISI